MRSLLYFCRISLPSGRAHALQVLRTTEAFARAGSAVTLYTRFAADLSGEPAQWIGAEAAPNLRIAVFTWRRKAVWPLAWRLTLWKAFAARPHPPVVYVRQIEYYTRTLARLARRLRLPLVYEAHSIKALLEEESSGPEAASAWDAIEREIFAKATGVVFTSAECERIARERYGWNGRGIVAPNAGPDPARDGEDSAAGTLGQQPAHPAEDGTKGAGSEHGEESGAAAGLHESAEGAHSAEIVYVGQLYPWKGVDLLIEAMRDLPGRRLTIAGGLDPRDVERVRALARTAGVAERVEFLGQLPPAKITALLARSRLGVIPLPGTGSVEARLFTAPLKLFEFWAAGVPVVASDLPSIRALARDGETALLCEPSAPALARTIERLLGDGELARRLADAGRAAAAGWTWDERARRILDFIASITP